MNATGKKRRSATGLTRAKLRRANHTHKSPAKIRRMGWTRDKTKDRHQEAA